MADIETRELPLADIRTDGSTQPRASVHPDAVAEYAEEMLGGARFPPVEVVYDGEVYWLWDGFHRWHAAKKAGLAVLLANIRSGNLALARWLSLGANRGHGIRRSTEDKQRAVLLALYLRPGMSDRAIAQHCGVSHPMVSSHRPRPLEDSSSEPQVRTGLDGRTIDTTNIGKGRDDDAPGLFSASESQPEQPPSRADPLARYERFPHSERLINWLRRVQGDTFVIRVELGGIKALLAEPEKWDWGEVRTYLLPMLDGLAATVREFHTEIQNACPR
jgi:uncharacterized ParB-like nuclease family protein